MGDADRPDGGLSAAYRRTAAPFPFRVHQAAALDEIDRLMVNGGHRRAWVVLPPGTGKTLVGLETIRRLGAPAVVFGPNTAIQTQWVRQWREFHPRTVAIGTDRTLETPVTALTYQALATFDADTEVDEEGHHRPRGTGRRGRLLDRLHPNGQALVDALHRTEPLTLVLDECHHLLEVWGRLVAELLDLVPHAYVLGLTATPPQSLTRDQQRLVDGLFGRPVYDTSIPSVVREGHLAPFAELAWLTTPTPPERAWLAAQAERFRELTTDLLDPSFGELPFLAWLDRRFVRREPPVPWHRLERDEPELTAAALRLHHAELLDLPEGARLREEHRRPPTADDWVRLIDDWVRNRLSGSTAESDRAVLAELRRALPSVGYNLTKRGIRVGRSPVDRVLARSEAKSLAAVEIAAAEDRHLGEEARVLILCDHEHASATLPATLRGVLSAEAGSAWLMLERLLADPRTAALRPMLVTGRTVAAGRRTAEDFVAFARKNRPGSALSVEPSSSPGIVEIAGRWSPRVWVPLVTSYFEAGDCRALVGTRGLLGEGWDARRISALVDLTTATTPTAVVQTRGRALRTDPARPDKVALTWTVVCVTEEHPKGHADWDRFVRKHEGYFAIDETGDIVDGVAAVDRSFSPFSPPKVASFDAVNAGQLERATDRARIRDLWKIGTPYQDRRVHSLRVRLGTPQRAEGVLAGQVGQKPTARDPADQEAAAPGSRAPDFVAPGSTAPGSPARDRGMRRQGTPDAARPPSPPAAVPAPDGPVRVDGRPLPRIPAAYGPAALGVMGLAAVPAFLGAWPVLVAVLVVAGTVLGAYQARLLLSAAALVAEAAAPVEPSRIAYAVADGLKGAGLVPVGAEAVTVRADQEGEYRFALGGVDAVCSAEFAHALDEALSPMAAPRYVVPRYVLVPPGPRPVERLRAGAGLLQGRTRPAAAIWHAVPSALGMNAERAGIYAQAWRRWVSEGEPLYTGSAEGAGVLAGQRGADPLDVTTALRLTWH